VIWFDTQRDMHKNKDPRTI